MSVTFLRDREGGGKGRGGGVCEGETTKLKMIKLGNSFVRGIGAGVPKTK